MHMLLYIFVEIKLVCLQLSTIEVYMSNPIVSLFPEIRGYVLVKVLVSVTETAS